MHGGAEAAPVTSPRRVRPLRAAPKKRILAVVVSGSSATADCQCNDSWQAKVSVHYVAENLDRDITVGRAVNLL